MVMSLGNKTLCELCNSKAYRKQKAKKESEAVEAAAEEDTEDSEDDSLNAPYPSIVGPGSSLQ